MAEITTVTTLKSPKRNKAVGMYLIEINDGEVKTRQGYLIRDNASSQELTIQLLANALHIINRVKCDKAYVKVSIDEPRVAGAINNKWLDEWKANGWQTSKGKEVANAESWKILEEKMADKEIEISTEPSSYTNYLRYQAEKLLERSNEDARTKENDKNSDKA